MIIYIVKINKYAFYSQTWWAEWERMLSCPWKSTWLVIISARIQAADHTSTVGEGGGTRDITQTYVRMLTGCTYFCCCWDILTCLTVVHPVEYDLWCSVPARHDVTGHFTLRLSGQAKVQNLKFNTENKTVTVCSTTRQLTKFYFILFFV